VSADEAVAPRSGGDLVVETLRALGADTVFGLPGQHALGLFEALRRAPDLRLIGARVENNLAFAADGHARARLDADPHGPVPVTPMIVSTGPGALLTLASLQEARASSVPVLGISSQVPTAGLGGGRHGYLHELPDQQASFRGVVKSVHVARTSSEPDRGRAPAGEGECRLPPVRPGLGGDTAGRSARALGTAADHLGRGRRDRPCSPARPDRRGGPTTRWRVESGDPGRRRGGQGRSERSLRDLAEALRAPVLCTFGGKGAFGWEHPLSGQSWLEDWHSTEFLADADVLLVLGSGLGELSSNYHRFTPRGQLIQIDADPPVLESNHAALGIHADVALALDALVAGVPPRPQDGRAEAAVAGLLQRIRDRIGKQRLDTEQRLLAGIRAALPPGTPSFWDMTILGYWAWSAWNPDDAPIHTAQGASGLGYGLPAALGAAAARNGPTLAVSGDGGAMYGIAELATAVQHGLDVTWLVVDDGGYGILREYLTGEFGQTHATELARPDFAALASSFGVPAIRSTVESLRADLAAALGTPGPSMVVLPAVLRMFEPTHLEDL
jgi:acetolactate synthase-1/2/3 large subunit